MELDGRKTINEPRCNLKPYKAWFWDYEGLAIWTIPQKQ